MNEDIEKIMDALENGDLIKTHYKVYRELWDVLEKHKKELN